MKRCRDCCEDKPVAKFRKGRNTCYACASKRNRERDPEGVRASVRRSHKEHGARYRAVNREQRAASLSQWKRDNPKKVNEYERQRRLRKRVAQIPYNRWDIFERDAWICHLCDEPVIERDPAHRFGPTIDHLVALSKGGIDAADNVKLAHRSCNSARHNRDLVTTT